MEVKIDRNTGEISEAVSTEALKAIMLAWKARKVSDEDFEEIRNVWKTTIIRCEDCPYKGQSSSDCLCNPRATAQSFNHP